MSARMYTYSTVLIYVVNLDWQNCHKHRN